MAGRTTQTRTEILAVARELFSRPGGYRAASMQRIADRLQITKAALYYHFRSKDQILYELTEPMLQELEQVLDSAVTESDLRRVREATVVGTMDAMLAHRDVLAMLLADLSLLTGTAVGDRLGTIVLRGQQALAGPDADLGERIRAFQLTSGLANTITRFADVPTAELRRHLLDSSRVVLDGLAELSD